MEYRQPHIRIASICQHPVLVMSKGYTRNAIFARVHAPRWGKTSFNSRRKYECDHHMWIHLLNPGDPCLTIWAIDRLCGDSQLLPPCKVESFDALQPCEPWQLVGAFAHFGQAGSTQGEVEFPRDWYWAERAVQRRFAPYLPERNMLVEVLSNLREGELAAQQAEREWLERCIAESGGTAPSAGQSPSSPEQPGDYAIIARWLEEDGWIALPSMGPLMPDAVAEKKAKVALSTFSFSDSPDDYILDGGGRVSVIPVVDCIAALLDARTYALVRFDELEPERKLKRLLREAQERDSRTKKQAEELMKAVNRIARPEIVIGRYVEKMAEILDEEKLASYAEQVRRDSGDDSALRKASSYVEGVAGRCLLGTIVADLEAAKDKNVSCTGGDLRKKLKEWAAEAAVAALQGLPARADAETIKTSIKKQVYELTLREMAGDAFEVVNSLSGESSEEVVCEEEFSTLPPKLSSVLGRCPASPLGNCYQAFMDGNREFAKAWWKGSEGVPIIQDAVSYGEESRLVDRRGKPTTISRSYPYALQDLYGRLREEIAKNHLFRCVECGYLFIADKVGAKYCIENGACAKYYKKRRTKEVNSEN